MTKYDLYNEYYCNKRKEAKKCLNVLCLHVHVVLFQKEDKIVLKKVFKYQMSSSMKNLKIEINVFFCCVQDYSRLFKLSKICDALHN
jgi:hypothetical protein